MHYFAFNVATNAALFADANSRVWAQKIGLAIAGVVVAFAVWQFREQLYRVRRPDEAFRGASERDFKFLKRQAFRRLQLSGLAGIVGASMLFGLYWPFDESPLLWASIWLAVVFFSGWVALLACVDATSIWLHYSSDERRRSAEKILLEYKLRRAREDAAKKCEEDAKNSKKNDSDVS